MKQRNQRKNSSSKSSSMGRARVTRTKLARAGRVAREFYWRVLRPLVREIWREIKAIIRA